MPSTYTVGELTSMIKQMLKMDLSELGENSSTQNQYIWYYMTLAMWRFVSLAYIVRTSDTLTVSADGYVTFKRATTDIDDLYEQLRILDSSGSPVQKRTSWDAPAGWWRESINSQIHIKGIGTYTMQYKAYPTKVTGESQTLEWPATSYDLLMYQTCGMVKESKNYYEEANNYYSIADKLLPILAKSNIDAQGTTNGRPPNMQEVQYYRR